MSDPLDLAWRLLLTTALAIFLGFGFEETYKREERAVPGGIRTFPLLALGGAALWLIEPHYAAPFVAGLLALALWLYGAMRTTGPSLMIPASSALAYILGPLALTQPYWVPVAIAVVSVLLLGGRERLHGLIQQLPRDEVFIAGEFLILVGVILPLLPNRQITALVPLTPYQVWLAVVAVCTLSYLSYLLQKYSPLRNAALLSAVLGGIYSSTATTIVLARQQRETDKARGELAAGIVAATAVMYVRIAIVLALFNLRFALDLSPALGGLFLAGAVIASVMWYLARRKEGDEALRVSPANPLQLQTAFVFALLFVVISGISAWTKAVFGSAGLLAVAGVVGFSDIDPFVINIAQGGVHGLSPATLGAAVLISASSNNLAKAAYAVGFGRVGAARRAAAVLVLLALAGFAVAFVL